MAVKFTPDQQKILKSRGHDLLVSAAAGSGKTAVLAERILRRITDKKDPVDVDRILVVTFTKAAAAGMRERIGQAIARAIEENPHDLHLQRQEALLATAKITTIDSFCAYLLRNHFAEIGLDPGFRQMEEAEAKLLEREVIGEMLEEKYRLNDAAFLECAEYFAPGPDDSALEDLILDLYRAANAQARPGRFLEARKQDYCMTSEEALEAQPWMRSWLAGMTEQAEDVRALYESMIAICEESDGPWIYLPILQEEKTLLFPGEKLPVTYPELLSFVHFSFIRLPGKKMDGADPAKKEAVQSLRKEAKDILKRLSGRLYAFDETEELAHMQAIAPRVTTLLDLTLEFRKRLAEKKTQQSRIDFQDLEHHALSILLRENEDGELVPTETAVALRKAYAEIMIDEYQDSNDVQELLLRTLSGEAEGRLNRFMVGDVKQSIYKFRLARPEIFMNKFETYAPDDPKRERIDLDRNFRSRPEVLDAVNAVFSRVMRREVGGVDYTDEVSLKVGNEALQTDPEGRYQTELLIIDRDKEKEDPLQEESKPEREALCVARKIKEIVGRLPVRDADSGEERPLRYGDITILMRNMSGYGDVFRATLEAEGVPVHAINRGGFYEAEEIRCLEQLLRVLTNFRQDIPLYGVLRGPFGGFSEEEVVRLRAMDPEGALLDALTAAAKAPESKREGHTFARAKTLLETLRRWRALSRSLPVYDLLQHIFAETDYLFAVAAMPAGEQRSANVALFLSQADAFGSTRDADLSHFIRQWDVHREQGIDYGEANVLREDADVVRITTIHKSKGLEYPVVFVAGLGRLFNKKDMQAMLLVDGDAGLGCNYFEPETRLRLTTLRREAVAEKMLTDMLGEEMRVLYVAMTRAKDKLYMTASIDKYAQKAERILNRQAGGSARQLSVSALKHATSFSDWVLQALLPSDAPSVKISVVDGATLRLMKEQEQLDMKEALAALTALEKRDGAVPDPGLQKVLEEALESEYGHPELAGLFTKTTVTELKRAQLPTAEEQDEEEKAAKAPWLVAKDADSHMGQNEATPGGAARGTAMHLLLQLLPYARFGDAATCSEDAIGAWIEEVIAAGKLTREETDERMAKELLVFLQSPVGERMAAAERRGELYREQPFVLGLPATEFRPDFPSEETILVQGIIDAFFREDDALVVVDYKTDRIRRESDLAARYEKQLAIYARALEQLLQVPVKERILYSVFLGKEIRT